MASIRTAANDLLNNPRLNQLSKDMSDFDKTIFTLSLAIGVVVITGTLGTIIGLLTATLLALFGSMPMTAIMAALAITGYFLNRKTVSGLTGALAVLLAIDWLGGSLLIQLLATLLGSFGFFGWLFLVNGYYKNGNLERSTGGFGGQFTSWIQPTGSSWWIPQALGGSREKPLAVDVRELDRTRAHGKHLTKVVTKDGADVEVSYYARYQLVDIEKGREVRDLDQAYQAIMDRAARSFVGHWDADPGQAYAVSSVQRKFDFSRFLEGATDIQDRDSNVIENDINEKIAELGLETDSVKVDDINPPPELIEARTRTIREAAEAEREKANIMARRDQALTLKRGDGTDRRRLNISDDRALDAAELAAGDRTIIQVDGSAKDFTKGQIGAAVFQTRRSKNK